MGRLRRSGGVVLVTLTLVATVVAAACAPSADAGPASPAGTDGPSSVPTTASGDGGSIASAGPSVDGSARLAAAFKALAAGYEFDTTVTIAGQTATHAAGHWLGGRSEFVVESGGTSLTYRSIPPRSWVYQDGSGWTELADKAPKGDPLEPLRHPSKVTVSSEDADALVLQATYPAKTLGSTGTASIVVQLSIAADGRTTATYVVDSGAGPATTVTILAAGTGAPIAVPSPAA